MDRTPEPVITGSFDGDADFLRVRALLVETYPFTPLDFNWDVRRWDGWRYYRTDPGWDSRWSERVRLWETADGRLVGAAHPEGSGDVHLQVHPDWRHLEEEMIAWAEERLAMSESDAESAPRRLRTFVFEEDAFRADLLERRGWERTSSGGVVHRVRLDHVPEVRAPIAEGYRLRATREGMGDAQRIAELLNAAFGRDFHTAAEHDTLAAHAASFRRHTDLVAETSDGRLACYVGAPYDEDNRRGILEPVCTHPDHVRRGLARMLTLEAMRRLRELGAAEVTVGTGDAEAANRFYDSLGFTETRAGKLWRVRRRGESRDAARRSRDRRAVGLSPRAELASG